MYIGISMCTSCDSCTSSVLKSSCTKSTPHPYNYTVQVAPKRWNGPPGKILLDTNSWALEDRQRRMKMNGRLLFSWLDNIISCDPQLQGSRGDLVPQAKTPTRRISKIKALQIKIILIWLPKSSTAFGTWMSAPKRKITRYIQGLESCTWEDQVHLQ